MPGVRAIWVGLTGYLVTAAGLLASSAFQSAPPFA